MAIIFWKLLIAGPAVILFGLVEPAHAQIATDGSVGPRIELDGPEFDIRADLGRQADRNLFHSFERFSLATGERATFSGPDQIRNVISRVTGGERSDIDGTLRSTIPGADFYFINPAGILFGPNASLDLSGSFHVSTADEVRFRDGARFSADLAAGSSFTVARPEAFGFLGGDRGTLSVADSQLQVQAGEAISLVGGEVTIASVSDVEEVFPRLGASGGTITVGAVAVGGGQFAIRSGRLDAPDGAPITIADAFIDTTGDGGGAIRIEGGRLLVDNSFAFADNDGSSDATGGVEIEADRVTLRNGSRVTADALASGNAGQVRVDATRVAIRSGSFIASDVHAGGNGGSVDVEADDILISGASAAGFFTGLSTGVTSGTGQGGQTTIHAGELQIADGGTISGTTRAEGRGGNVGVVADEISIDGQGSSNPTGIFASTTSTTSGAGHAGRIDVGAERLEIVSGGQIASVTSGVGDAGRVAIHAGEMLVDGEQVENFTGVSSGTNSGSSGDARPVQVTVDRTLSLRRGGEIDSSTAGSGDASTVRVDAHSLLMSDGAAIRSDADPGSRGDAGRIRVTADHIRLSRGAAISSAAEEGSIGDAGAIAVEANEFLTLHNGGVISSSTLAEGRGGSVRVAANNVSIDGQGSPLGTGIFAGTGGSGDAGTLDVIAHERVEILGGGQIASVTSGLGNAGRVAIQAGQVLVDGQDFGIFTGISSGTNSGSSGDARPVQVTVDGTLDLRRGGQIDSSTAGGGHASTVRVDADHIFMSGGAGITSDADPGSSGNAGRIVVIADDIQISGDAGITSQAEAEGSIGNAGTITVRANDLLTLRNGGNISSSTFAEGRGGNVHVVAGELTIRDVGQIASRTEGSGDAGLISVDAGDIRLTRGGNIDGSTSGSGRGGAITLSADNLFISGASSQFGLSGVFSSTISGESDAGRGGPIRVHAGTLQILDGGQVVSITNGAGNTGPIQIAADSILIAGEEFTGISGGTNQRSTGNAAPVRVNAKTLELRDGGRIDSSTDGGGDASTVRVRADDILIAGTHDGDGQIASGTASFSRGGGGDAGAVILVGDKITIRDGGEVDSSATLEGITGSITLTAQSLLLDRARISTSSETSGGGQIKLRAGDVIDLHDSDITTSIQGGDDRRTAGNITLNSDILVIDSGRMQANAPEGFGGRVTVDADNVVVVRGGDFYSLLERGDISATGGTSERAGTIAVDASELNLAGDLVVLQAPLLDAAALLRRPCGARQDVGASSFTAAGRGGLPAGPNAPLRSAYSGAQASSAPVAGGPPVLRLAGCAGAGDGSPG